MAHCRSRPAGWPMSTAGWRWCRRMWRMPARLDMRPRSPRRRASPRMASASACTAARRSAISTRCCRPRCSARTRRWPGCRRGRPRWQSIDAAQGTPGQGTDIASLLGKLQDQFSTLLNDPASAPQQSQVVSAATTLAQGINALSDAYTTQRQTAQDNIGTELATLNTTLGTIGGLSNKIVTLKAGGQSTADLENQRDAAMADLSQLLDVKALEQPNGDLMVATDRRPRSADPWRDKSVRHGGRERAARHILSGRRHQRDHPRRRRCHQPAPRRADRRQHRAARHDAADRPGGTGRIRAEPGEPLRRRRG